jgi:cysteine synthase A
VPTTQAPPADEAVDPKAASFVRDVVREQPVVLFALEWCEFCWAVRKLFARLAIPYESVDLDAVAFQDDDMGMKIRAALRAETGTPTIPQVFIGGERIGGCTDLFDAMRNGDMQRRLEAAGVAYDRTIALDPTRCCRIGCTRANPRSGEDLAGGSERAGRRSPCRADATGRSPPSATGGTPAAAC